MNELKIELTVYQGGYEELSVEQRKLVDKSKNAATLSHSPYSKFRVGCAIRLDDGHIVLGANQENAAYPMCLCAEGATLATIATQYPDRLIDEVAIYVPLDRPASPCGFCRQSFKEYEMRMKRKFRYILTSNADVYLFEGIDTILPLAFSMNDMP